MKNEKKKFGIHVIIDAWNCNFDSINDEVFLEKLFIESIKMGNMTLLNYNIHKFDPIGVSGIFLISESHLSFHSQPEYGYISIDMFTCGDKRGLIKAYNNIIEKIGCKNYRLKIFNRGKFENKKIQ